MSENEIADEILHHVLKRYGTKEKAAQAWGVSTAFVSMVTNGKKRPTQAILSEVGYRKVVSYEVAA
jgi:hypothetical protein